MSKKQSHYIQLDLIIYVLILAVVSILAIYNAEQIGQYPDENFVVKQIVYYLIGFSALIILQFFDLETVYKSSLYIYLFGVFSLIALHFSPESIAKPVNNAKSWFNGSMFPLTIQPAEFAKIALILFLAMVIVKHREKFGVGQLKSDLWLIGKIVIATVVPALFIIEQPDLGTSVVFFFIAGILIILSGVDWKILTVLIVAGAAAVTLAILLVVNFPTLAQSVLGIKPYQMDRIMTWFDPSQQVQDDRFHIERSLLTIGSGQLTGKGMNNPEVALPEAHTDFIFSIIGESFGFIGAAFVIFIFFLLLYKLVTLGMKTYEFNPFGAYICFGFMALLLIHTFQNIGMTIGITPITGIPLLFISYGGSTILSTMIGYAFVYRVAIEQSKHEDFLFK